MQSKLSKMQQGFTYNVKNWQLSKQTLSLINLHMAIFKKSIPKQKQPNQPFTFHWYFPPGSTLHVFLDYLHPALRKSSLEAFHNKCPAQVLYRKPFSCARLSKAKPNPCVRVKQKDFFYLSWIRFYFKDLIRKIRKFESKILICNFGSILLNYIQNWQLYKFN